MDEITMALFALILVAGIAGICRWGVESCKVEKGRNNRGCGDEGW